MAVLWLWRGRFSPSSSVYLPYGEGEEDIVCLFLFLVFFFREGAGWWVCWRVRRGKKKEGERFGYYLFGCDRRRSSVCVASGVHNGCRS